ncbi:growth factor receptor-bound protein 10 isoform X3 [Nematostella vectensis]|uniref:growth factor receptor-bound protein 10 isoform X3 n=2 Tax=Nematostella vectensis TaxID=45351 RepID=UPI00207716F7|nr:growth factor receptor-bound protein 10 isoform X3 [Nematostella vectensis]
MRQRKRFTHGMMVSYSKNSKYEDQELMLDSLLAECDDCDDDRPLIPPREPIVAMKLSPPPQRQKKSLNTHMWVTLPDKECLPSGEVASDGEVTGKFTQKSDFEQDAPQSPGSMPIKVFNEDNSSVTFSVGQNTTAMEACYKLVLLNAIKEDPTWVLVEHLTDLGIERNLEDHEKVIDVYNSLAGNSKLLFRKDPTKYDFFTNTAKYADTKLFEDENTEDKAVSEKARKAKKILLMNLLSKCTRVPEISDVLHIKDYTKKSWTKKFIILRGSGLYTSHKGKSKAFKDLQSFAQFDGNNLYTMLNANKSHKAPTNFAFSLAPSGKDAKEVKCFCVDEEKMYLGWLLGIRLAKYGPQLRQNYDDMLRKFAILARLEPLPPVMDTPPRPVPTESQPVNQDSLPSDRVAMDFTGTRGKLVTNCKEIEELTKRQKPQLSRRLSANHFISNSSSTGKELAEEFWFHGRISHEEALVLMKREGFEDGLFLVRESCSVSDVYVLTFCMNKKVFHCQLVQDIGPGSKMYYRLDKGPAFPSILELIRYYQRKTVNGISVALRRPCTVKRRRNFSCV